MPFEVSTKDCAQLTEGELADFADLSADGPSCHPLERLTEESAKWVLVTQVREGNLLRAFSFATLERIGGTPAVVLGVACVKRNAKREQALRALMGDNYRRALMAFPDEDVLVGTRMVAPDAFEAFKALVDINPRPGHRASGEERAWGRRLAKRFGMDAGYDDRVFVAKGDGSYPLALEHESTKPDRIDADVAALFEPLTPENGDCLVGFGWMMAEDLLKFNG